jgi:hypothetical protein
MAAEFQFFDSKELEYLETIAQRRGYTEPREYLRALVDADAREHGEPVLSEGDEVVDIHGELKEALRQALRGETVPLESLWTDDDE